MAYKKKRIGPLHCPHSLPSPKKPSQSDPGESIRSSQVALADLHQVDEAKKLLQAPRLGGAKKNPWLVRACFFFHLLENRFFPLLVLKRICYYCFFFSRGLNQMECFKGLVAQNGGCLFFLL